MQKIGSHRETANGWIMWKTEDGTYLNEFYNKIYSTEEKEYSEEEVARPVVETPLEEV
jgi:hypothetical protein